MAGVKVLISWDKEPYPDEDSFCSFLINWFSWCTGKKLQIDTNKGGKLNYLRAKLASSPLFAPASRPEEVVDGRAFLQQVDEEDWVYVCDWNIMHEAITQLNQPLDTILLYMPQQQVYSLLKTSYIDYCTLANCKPYPMVHVPMNLAKRGAPSQSASAAEPATQDCPNLPTESSRTGFAPFGPPPSKSEDQRNPPYQHLAPRTEFGTALVSAVMVDKQIKEAEALIQVKTKAAEAEIATKINQIPVRLVTDPNIQGENVGKDMSDLLQRLVIDKEQAAKALCMSTSNQVAASMQSFVRTTQQSEQDYKTVTATFDQNAQSLASRLQQIEQQFTASKAGASIQADLAQLEAEIQGFERALENLNPPPRYPLRIISTCGKDVNTYQPCPVLVIQWKDWSSGSEMRVKFDAQGDFKPSEAVLREAVTVLPYSCDQDAILLVTSDTNVILCKHTVYIYTAQTYAQSSYFVDWEIDPAQLANGPSFQQFA